MRVFRPGTVPLLIALSLFGTSSVATADTELTRLSLRGVGTIYVVVEDLPAGAQKIGLSTESIRTEVELRLRQNGIKVVDVNGIMQANLYVSVNVSSSGEAASLSVQLREPVRLVRDQSLSVVATTWDASTLVSNANATFIRESVVELIDHFLNAWLSVNPKTR